MFTTCATSEYRQTVPNTRRTRRMLIIWKRGRTSCGVSSPSGLLPAGHWHFPYNKPRASVLPCCPTARGKNTRCRSGDVRTLAGSCFTTRQRLFRCFVNLSGCAVEPSRMRCSLQLHEDIFSARETSRELQPHANARTISCTNVDSMSYGPVFTRCCSCPALEELVGKIKPITVTVLIDVAIPADPIKTA